MGPSELQLTEAQRIALPTKGLNDACPLYCRHSPYYRTRI
jgi:hypothetical protein